jgi:hypothetical protein
LIYLTGQKRYLFQRYVCVYQDIGRAPPSSVSKAYVGRGLVVFYRHTTKFRRFHVDATDISCVMPSVPRNTKSPPADDVHVSRLIRYARAWSKYDQFLSASRLLRAVTADLVAALIHLFVSPTVFVYILKMSCTPPHNEKN